MTILVNYFLLVNEFFILLNKLILTLLNRDKDIEDKKSKENTPQYFKKTNKDFQINNAKMIAI